MELSDAEKRIGTAMGNFWRREHPEVTHALSNAYSTDVPTLLAIINASIAQFNARYECPDSLSGEFIFASDEELLSFVLTYGD